MHTSQTVHVSYKGTAPAEAALVAGEIDYMVDPPTALPFVTAGFIVTVLTAYIPFLSNFLPDLMGIQ